MSFGSAEKTVPCVWHADVVRGRVLEVGDGEVGALDEVADRARRCRSARVRQVPAERRAALQRPVIVGGPAVEREVGALALDLERLVRRRGRA